MADTRLRKRGTKNGRDVWTAVVPLPRGADGSRRQHRFTFVGNKTDTHKALVAELSGIETGGFVAPKRTSLGEYLRDWLASSGPGYSGPTFQRFEAVIRCHLIPALGDIDGKRRLGNEINYRLTELSRYDNMAWWFSPIRLRRISGMALTQRLHVKRFHLTFTG
jgi:hypothetical protein